MRTLKIALAIIASLTIAVESGVAGESMLTTTWQPLSGLGAGGIKIVPVACHHWYGSSGVGSAIDLIATKNVPPTDNPKQATEDLNLASVCGLGFGSSDLGAEGVPLEIYMNATKFAVPKRFGSNREEIIRACLECLRRAMPERLRKTPLTLKATDADKKWLSKIVAAFNEHDREKVFFAPQE